METEGDPTPEFVKAEFVRDFPSGKLQLSTPLFNPELEAFVADAEVDQEGEIPRKNVVALFPMRKGVLKVFVFMARDDAMKFPELAHQLLSGIRIYDDYKPAGAKRSPKGLIATLIALGILALVIWKSKPAKSGELPSRRVVL
jgi:hypothetical protein